MKQKQAVAAYKALNTIGAMDLPPRVAYRFFKIKAAIQEVFNFEMESERKFLEELKGIIEMDGSLRFPDLDSARKFNQKVAEIGEVEVDVKYEPITISLDELGDIKLKPNDMEALIDFVTFE